MTAQSKRRSQRSDPLPLGQGGRWWVIELHEVNGCPGQELTPAGEYPQGSVPPQWRAEWWMAAARACHDMAMRCEREAREEMA